RVHHILLNPKRSTSDFPVLDAPAEAANPKDASVVPQNRNSLPLVLREKFLDHLLTMHRHERRRVWRRRWPLREQGLDGFKHGGCNYAERSRSLASRPGVRCANRPPSRRRVQRDSWAAWFALPS